MNTTTINQTQVSIINHQDQPVITTELLAKLYGTDVDNIRQNFSRNADRFIEGKHFFKLEGEQLKAFASSLNDLCVTNSHAQISNKVRSLNLWTERGAARHAKMLDTDQAWQVFESLEDHYFNPTTKPQPLPHLQIGNLVRLKSGSSDYTISKIFPDTQQVEVVWYSYRRIQRDTIPIACIDFDLAQSQQRQNQQLQQFWTAIYQHGIDQLNHSHSPHRLSLSLAQIRQALPITAQLDLEQLLKQSNTPYPQYLGHSVTVRSRIDNKTHRCWQFATTQTAQTTQEIGHA